MVELSLDKDKLTKYEKARIIGTRSLQISMGAPILAKLTPKKLEELGYDPLEIAKIEWEQGIIPIDVKRNSGKPVEKPKK